MVERHADGEIRRDVRDVHPPAEAVPLPLDVDGVVEVLCGLGVDREAELVAQVDPTGGVGLRCLVRLEVGASLGMDEQPFEDDLDVLRRAEISLDPRPPFAAACDDEIAGTNLGPVPAVERERNTWDEVRLADEELAARSDLDDRAVAQGGS